MNNVNYSYLHFCMHTFKSIFLLLQKVRSKMTRRKIGQFITFLLAFEIHSELKIRSIMNYYVFYVSHE